MISLICSVLVEGFLLGHDLSSIDIVVQLAIGSLGSLVTDRLALSSRCRDIFTNYYHGIIYLFYLFLYKSNQFVSESRAWQIGSPYIPQCVSSKTIYRSRLVDPNSQEFFLIVLFFCFFCFFSFFLSFFMSKKGKKKKSIRKVQKRYFKASLPPTKDKLTNLSSGFYLHLSISSKSWSLLSSIGN